MLAFAVLHALRDNFFAFAVAFACYKLSADR
jgi:hypothetical protein